MTPTQRLWLEVKADELKQETPGTIDEDAIRAALARVDELENEVTRSTSEYVALHLALRKAEAENARLREAMDDAHKAFQMSQDREYATACELADARACIAKLEGALRDANERSLNHLDLEPGSA